MTKHLDGLTIGAYRGLRNLRLEGLGQANLLVGKNSCGKTSVLECMQLFASPLDPLAWWRIARNRQGGPVYYEPGFEALTWLFPRDRARDPADSGSGEILISGKGVYPLRELHAVLHEAVGYADTTRVDDVHPREVEAELEASEPRIGAELLLSARGVQDPPTPSEDGWSETSKVVLWEGAPLPHRKNAFNVRLPSRLLSPFAHRYEPFQLRELSRARLEGVQPDILELVRQFDTGVRSLEILSPHGDRPVLYVQHEQLGLAPLTAFGDGLRRILAIATGLVSVTHGVLLVDEIETAIHVGALTKTFGWLLRACREHNVQMFATTHSIEAIDALLAAVKQEDDLVLFRLEAAGDGTQAVRLGHSLLATLREELGQEVRC